VIELAVELPLARFLLRVTARLGGGVTAVMGPSGAGKTSLLEAIAGLRARTRGRVVVGDSQLFERLSGHVLGDAQRDSHPVQSLAQLLRLRDEMPKSSGRLP
jgi:molybdate transport system ATP-binding protein